MDYIYQEELENAVKDGVLSKVYTSFSRAPDQPKVRRWYHLYSDIIISYIYMSFISLFW